MDSAAFFRVSCSNTGTPLNARKPHLTPTTATQHMRVCDLHVLPFNSIHIVLLVMLLASDNILVLLNQLYNHCNFLIHIYLGGQTFYSLATVCS